MTLSELQTMCRTFTFSTLEEAALLAEYFAQFCNDSMDIRLGVGELLVNAIEHGNLGIGYTLKTRLLGEGTWLEEVSRRLADPRFAGRTAEAMLTTGRGAVELVISDSGEGFDWRRYVHRDPAFVTAPNGRGIAIASRCGFDVLRYNERGNVVHCLKRVDTLFQGQWNAA